MENEEILGENEKLECSFNFMPFVTDVASAVSRCDIKKIAVHLIRKTIPYVFYLAFIKVLNTMAL